MKIFQIVNNFCFKDYTSIYKSVEEAKQYYAPDIEFVEAPDFVFENWGYNPDAEGDARFIKPTPPEGWEYDENTGTFYNPTTLIMQEIEDLKQQLASTDYQIIKCSECSMLGQPLPYDLTALHQQRQEIRNQINELEAQL